MQRLRSVRWIVPCRTTYAAAVEANSSPMCSGPDAPLQPRPRQGGAGDRGRHPDGLTPSVLPHAGRCRQDGGTARPDTGGGPRRGRFEIRHWGLTESTPDAVFVMELRKRAVSRKATASWGWIRFLTNFNTLEHKPIARNSQIIEDFYSVNFFLDWHWEKMYKKGVKGHQRVVFAPVSAPRAAPAYPLGIIGSYQRSPAARHNFIHQGDAP